MFWKRLRKNTGQVVPYVGTWIEMVKLPSELPVTLVVPYVGTWIEIDGVRQLSPAGVVVPYVGTWIEIYKQYNMVPEFVRSFPTWERG